MRSGRLKRQVTIERLAGGSPRQGSSGERRDAWAAFLTLRAGIRTLSGRELEAAQQRHADIAVEVELRHVAGIEAGMRVVHKALAYSILAVRDPDLAERRLLLDCSIGVVNAAVTA